MILLTSGYSIPYEKMWMISMIILGVWTYFLGKTHLSALAARKKKTSLSSTHIRMTKCFTSSICKQHWNKLISNWWAPLCKSLKKNVFSVFSILQTLNKTHLLVFPQQKTTQISPEIFPQQKSPRFPAKISLHFPSGRFVPTCSAVAAVKMGRLRRLMPSPQWMK